MGGKGALQYGNRKSVLRILFSPLSVQPSSLPSPSIPKKIRRGNHCIIQKECSGGRSAECPPAPLSLAPHDCLVDIWSSWKAVCARTPRWGLMFAEAS